MKLSRINMLCALCVLALLPFVSAWGAESCALNETALKRSQQKLDLNERAIEKARKRADAAESKIGTAAKRGAALVAKAERSAKDAAARSLSVKNACQTASSNSAASGTAGKITLNSRQYSCDARSLAALERAAQVAVGLIERAKQRALSGEEQASAALERMKQRLHESQQGRASLVAARDKERSVLEACRQKRQPQQAQAPATNGASSDSSPLFQGVTRLMARGLDLKLMNPWSSSAPTSFSYNPGCWAAPLDWTGVASAIEGCGTMGGGTLISRRHILLADHVAMPPYEPGRRPVDIWFTNRAGRVFAHKVVRTVRVPDTDISIGTLDRDADPSLRVYRVLPDGWERRLSGANPTTGPGFGAGPWTAVSMRLPVIYTNQDRFALTADVTLVLGPQGGGMNADVSEPISELAKPYYLVQRGGDSGNPIFTLIGDELVLLGAWHRVGRFPWLIGSREQVEGIMGQKLQTVDLASLPGFEQR